MSGLTPQRMETGEGIYGGVGSASLPELSPSIAAATAFLAAGQINWRVWRSP